MSADNQITIRQKGKAFHVFEHCVEYPNDESNWIGKASTLTGALTIAKSYEQGLNDEGSCVEYGTRFEIKEKK